MAENPRPHLTGRMPYLTLFGAGIRPTFYGFVFLGMLAALLLGSINHNNNLGYLLTFLLSGLLLASVRATWRNVGGVFVDSCRADPAFAGGEARFAVHLRAEGERFGLRLDAPDAPSMPSSGRTGDFSDMVPEANADLRGGTGTAEVRQTAERRGMLRLDRLALTSRFPFGLFECRRFLTVDASCLVYPRPIVAPPLAVGSGEEENEAGAAHTSTGLDFSGISPYRPGDSLSRIHWKSLARGQGLHVTEFDDENAGGAVFTLAKLPGNDLEYKLSCLCHMVLVASGQGRRYGLDLGARRIPPGRGLAHRRRCLEALALHGISRGRPRRRARAVSERAGEGA